MKHLLLAVFIAAPAAAETLTAENCDFAFKDRNSEATCDFTNHSAEAIASFSYRVVISQSGREVPWLDTKDGPAFEWPISGGIEPGETANIFIRMGHIPNRAERSALKIEVSPFNAKNSAGELID